MAATIPFILIAEDEPAHAEAIERAFETAGVKAEFQVVGALKEYRQAVAARTPDLALVDVNLPDGKAMEVLTWPPEAGSFPVVVMTSYGDEQMAVDAMKRGALDYIAKSPEGFADMPRTVRRALDQWELLQGRKRAEEALRESEAKYRLISENAADVIWTMEIATRRFTYVSPSIEKLRGYTVQEVMSQTLEEAMTSESFAFVAAKLPERLEAFRAGDPTARVWTNLIDQLCKDGSIVHTEVTTTIVADEQGRPAQLIGVTRDIGERKQAEERVIRSEASLRQAQRVAHVGSWAWDIKTNHLEWSDEMYRIFGIEKDGFSGELGDVVDNAIHPDDRATVNRANLAVINDKKHPPMEYRVVWPDETIHVVWAEPGELMLDAEGNPAVLTGIVQDITERKRAEQLLQASEHKFRSLFENAQMGMFRTKLDGSAILDMNQRYLDIFGRSREEMKGEPSTINWADPLERKEMVRRIRADGSISQMECRMLNKRGEVRNCLASLQICPGEEILEGSIVDITERKQVEMALRESEHFVQRILEATPSLVYIYDLVDCRNVYANRDIARFLGYTPEQIKAFGPALLQEIVHPDDAHLVAEHHAQCLAASDGNVLNAEYRMRHSNGQWRWLHSSDVVFARNAEGTVRSILGCAEDVTDRKQAEAAMREVSDRLLLATGAAKMGIWDWDIVGNRLTWDSVMCQLYGITPGQFTDTYEAWERRLHPADLLRMRAESQMALRGEKDYDTEFRVIWPDGSIRYVKGRAVVQRDASGQPIRMLGTNWDITDRKILDNELALREQQLNGFFGNATAGLAFVDKDMRFIRVNDSLAAMNGPSAQDHLGKTVREMVPALAAKVEPMLRKVFATGEPISDLQVTGETPSQPGLCRQWLESFFPIKREGGSVEAVGAIAVETTEVKRLAEQLRQAQKMEAVGRLAAGVAHDFNNQLTVVLGYCEMLLKDRQEGDPMWECLTQIQYAGQRAASTTSHLLSFSRKQVLHAESVNLAQFLREVEKPISRMIGEDIKLTVVATPSVPSVSIDKSGLHQVIMNLAVNARDAMPNGGKLILRTSFVKLNATEAAEYPEAPEGNYVLLEVIDSGVGMDSQTLERVFEPFFTTKEPGKGTGLGLPMVMGFIGQSHGFINIQSQLGKGTNVRLLLPPAQIRVLASKNEALPAPVDEKNNRTIMVVEDEDGVRGLLVRALQEHGYNVLAASGPAEALELSHKHGTIDLLISDMIMPEMKGDELARKLKSARRGLRVLFVTGYSDVNVQRGASLLRKPIKMDEFLARVKSLLSRRPKRMR
jgi:PAS domain S-box-containing protein